jgi:uncharacterized protein (DUF433 family)
MVTARQDQYRERITNDPQILAGKAVVRGTRIPVTVVLEYLSNNPNFDDLFADYPRLTLADIKACLAYAQERLEADKDSPHFPKESAGAL